MNEPIRQVHFGTLDEFGQVSGERTIPQARIVACPHVIMLAEHYPEADDALCRCFDPEAQEMAEAGYVWSEKARRWEAP